MSDKINFTDEQYIELINILCKLDLEEEEYTPITSMNDSLNLDILDSLSLTVFFIWLVHLFEIPESDIQEFVKNRDFTIKAIKELILTKATKISSYETIKEDTLNNKYFTS